MNPSFTLTQQQYDDLGVTLFWVSGHPYPICGACGELVPNAGVPCWNCGVAWDKVTNYYHVSNWTADNYRDACAEFAPHLTYVTRENLLPGDVFPLGGYRGQATLVTGS